MITKEELIEHKTEMVLANINLILAYQERIKRLNNLERAIYFQKDIERYNRYIDELKKENEEYNEEIQELVTKGII